VAHYHPLSPPLPRLWQPQDLSLYSDDEDAARRYYEEVASLPLDEASLQQLKHSLARQRRAERKLKKLAEPGGGGGGGGGSQPAGYSPPPPPPPTGRPPAPASAATAHRGARKSRVPDEAGMGAPSAAAAASSSWRRRRRVHRSSRGSQGSSTGGDDGDQLQLQPATEADMSATLPKLPGAAVALGATEAAGGAAAAEEEEDSRLSASGPISRSAINVSRRQARGLVEPTMAISVRRPLRPFWRPF
jgi:hypothetical protein